MTQDANWNEIGSTSLGFDANGNLTTDQNGKTLVYDAWNRLVEQKDGATSEIAYAYDGLGRRIAEGSPMCISAPLGRTSKSAMRQLR